MRRFLSGAMACLIAAATPSAAQVVVNGGAPNGGAGYDIFNDFRSADDFQLTGATLFDQIRFWGILPSGSAYAPTIFWQILTDASGLPGSVVAGGSATAASSLRTALGASGFSSYQFDLSVGAQNLATGVYWLALHDGAVGDITDSSLIWETTDAGRGSDFSVAFIPDDQWTGGWSGNLAFELRSTETVVATPEPMTLTLVATGFAAAGLARRKRRKLVGGTA